jgi:hypothetical protein
MKNFNQIKTATAVQKLYSKILLLSMIPYTLLPQQMLANPMGANVQHGQIVVGYNGNVTSITQSSEKGIINWDSFSIGKS